MPARRAAKTHTTVTAVTASTATATQACPNPGLKWQSNAPTSAAAKLMGCHWSMLVEPAGCSALLLQTELRCSTFAVGASLTKQHCSAGERTPQFSPVPGTGAASSQPTSTAEPASANGSVASQEVSEDSLAGALLTAEKLPLQPVPRHMALRLSPACSGSAQGGALDAILPLSRRDSGASSPAPGSPGIRAA